ncbi:hydroxyacid dehydrogenase [Aestuariivirga litoralis]|uniref:Hydroxyacid dehydrogenase n=1 Tax=Aestuariivirga litoralis TaxID=2650924 RepID=A0A2W2APW6_9HYPH|nr:FAD-binding oxidoreductase [Aestuariivirga litoralis]PZF75632.1 hydroxyacid dehydrogenase [Aestuariivirga litoralis]
MSDALNRLAAVVGEKHAIRDAAGMDGYMREWRQIWTGRSPLVLRPGSTEDVSRILAIANETRTPIVPQAGNTGLCGGQIPTDAGNEVVLSLERMTRILDVDAADNTITVEAGAVLKSVQEAADAVDRFFPLSLASEGSCRIGGNLSTNAGGLNVIAYGNTRDLCLGLEVVLADGRVWNGLKRLRKDNTGYDLRDLFIGAEGTLGVITAAVLKLFPKPRTVETAFIAVPSPQAAVDLLSLARELSGNRVVGFELIADIALQFAIRHAGVRHPLAEASPWYVLAELADPVPGAMMAIFESAMARGLVTDAALAQSDAQRSAFWAARELISESQKSEGGSIKHDVSVPVSKVPQFLAAADEAVSRFLPGSRFVSFGHLGDGNIHYNISQPVGMDKEAFLGMWNEVNDVVFEVVGRFNGSISAEHGIGRLKAYRMPEIKSAVELDMMRGLKRLLDPNNILNPGRVLPE